jgi:hypothetical protein
MRLLSPTLFLTLGLLTALFYYLDGQLSNFYIFDPAELHALSQSAIAAHGNDTEAVVNFIVDDLKDKFPGYVNLEREWVFNNAGGAMGAMYIIHASVTEYLIVFGELGVFVGFFVLGLLFALRLRLFYFISFYFFVSYFFFSLLNFFWSYSVVEGRLHRTIYRRRALSVPHHT